MKNTNKTQIKIQKPNLSAAYVAEEFKKVFDCFQTLSHKCIKYNCQLHLDFLRALLILKTMTYHKVDKPACLIIRLLFRFASDSLEQWQ